MFNHFNGKVIQVIDALDMYDACSDHVVNIDKAFSDVFGLKTRIYVHHLHPHRQNMTFFIDSLDVNEEDILFYHYSGYSERCADIVTRQNCFKILHYHTITPHYFFAPNSFLYEHCKKGREQLKALLHHFDFVTGDSHYNIKELVDLGFDAHKTFKLPIIINDLELSHQKNGFSAKQNNILFVGRICENKRQDRLVSIYAALKERFPSIGRLVLVGGYDKSSPFFQRIEQLISDYHLEKQVLITGKISQPELDEHYRHAMCFISVSEHEGFGVPLLEAAQYHIPVLALDDAAVSETLDNSPCIFSNEQELFDKFEKLLTDKTFRQLVLDHQQKVIKKSSYIQWLKTAEQFLNKVIGAADRFKYISFVICTFNRADYLERCLDYLTRHYNNDFEVVVVNGPSTDNTAAVIDKWRDRIIYADNPLRNLSVSRNIGVALASGDIVAFIDDDAIPFYDWSDKILAYYNSAHNFVAGVGGPTWYAGELHFQAVDILVDNFGSGIIDPDKSLYKDPGYRRSLLGTNSSFRRDYLLAVGSFDEEYDYFLDETDVCFRLIEAGYRIQHCSDAYLRHEFAQSDNRSSQYKYNWYSIVKNTAYFALRFNQGDPDFIIRQTKKLVERERVTYLENGLRAGEMSRDEFNEQVKNIWAGFAQGIHDATLPRKLIATDSPAAEFKPFKTTLTVAAIKRHIVLVSKEFPPFTRSGGIGTLYYHLASEFLLQGHDVTIITQGENVQFERGSFRLIRLPAPAHAESYCASALTNINLTWSLNVAKELDALHERLPISVVDTCLWDAECYAFTLIKQELAIPLVVRLVTPLLVADETNGWHMPETDKILLSGLEKAMVEAADAVIPISRSIEATFARKYGVVPDDRFVMINAGIAYWPKYDVHQKYNDIQHYPELIAAKAQGKLIVLFLGRLEKRKGIDVFVKAIGHFNNEYPDAVDDVLFVLAGHDGIGIDKLLTEVLGKQRHNLVVLGEVNDWDREKLYSHCDVVVFPSRYESFGLVPLEAFVHSKPVIASNAGAIPEVVLDGECGLLFDDGNDEALATQIYALISDSGLRTRLTGGAVNRVKQLSSCHSAQQSLSLYNRLISES